MKEYISPQTVNLIITGVVLPTVVYYLRRLFAYLEERSEIEKVDKRLGSAESAISTAVGAVNQVHVDGLKKNGVFGQAAKEEAFAMAKQRAISIMGDAAKEVAKNVYGNFDAWLDSRIEYYVKAGKK